MIEVLKLALLVIAEVLDLVDRAESGVVTPEAARQALENFRKQIQANDLAADAALNQKFSKKDE